MGRGGRRTLDYLMNEWRIALFVGSIVGWVSGGGLAVVVVVEEVVVVVEVAEVVVSAG